MVSGIDSAAQVLYVPYASHFPSLVPKGIKMSTKIF